MSARLIDRTPIRLRPYQVDEFRRLLASGVDYRAAARQASEYQAPQPTRPTAPSSSDARAIRPPPTPAPVRELAYALALGVLAYLLLIVWFAL